jgi:hypothetical protein
MYSNMQVFLKAVFDQLDPRACARANTNPHTAAAIGRAVPREPLPGPGQRGPGQRPGPS